MPSWVHNLSLVGTRRARDCGGKRRTVSAILLLTVITALILPGAASAGSYWFFQGYLPKADGTRQVFHANVCCDAINYLRMSWEVGSHGQKGLFIRRSDYGWDGEWAYDYDHAWVYSTITYVQAGCQNPYPWGATWTNCHVGLGL